MKKYSGLIFLVTVFGVLLPASCSHPFSSRLYYQQQAVEDGDSDPFGGGDDSGDDDDEEDETPGTSSSVFSVILADGIIDTDPFSENPEALESLRGKLPEISAFTSAALADSLIRSSFTSANVPVLWYEPGSWNPGNSDRREYLNSGPDTTAGSNSISDVVYYGYRGLNPFYSADSGYNTQKFSAGDETRMDRFIFYRFTGKTALPSLDNMLVAVDTYTGLFFSFGKPVEYKSYFGQNVPVKWAPVDKVCTDSSGKTHKFYEYDPAGYIDDEGKFITEEWYHSHMASGNYDPVYSGKSPYTVKIDNGPAIVPEITASRVEDGLLRNGETGKFYTEIIIKPQAADLRYQLYRLDDRSVEWIALGGSIPVSAGESYSFRDYDAFILTDLPKYKAEAFTVNDDLIDESTHVEGSRMLSNREALSAVMESLRLSFEKLWKITGSFTGSLSKGSFEGEEGTYYHGIDRNGFFGTNYRRFQRYDGFRNTLFVLNGTFMKDNGGGAHGLDKHGTWTGLGSSWPADGDFLPRTDFLKADFGSVSFEIRFNNILIDNNDGNEPEWLSGSFTVSSDFGTDEFNSTSGVPFSLFMEKGVVIEKLAGENYSQ